MRKVLLIILLIVASLGAVKAEEIIDGMCASKPMVLTSRHTGEDDRAMLNACVRFIDDQTKSSFKGNPQNDVVWWKDRYGAFVIAKCAVMDDKTIVYIASHHVKSKFSFSSVDTVWNLLVRKVAGL